MGALTNSEDKMPQNATECNISSGSALFAKTNSTSVFGEIIICGTSIPTVDHPDLSVLNSKENYIGPKWFKAHTNISRKTSGLMVGQSLHLHPNFMYARSEGSDKAVHCPGSSEPSLFDNVISTKIPCAC